MPESNERYDGDMSKGHRSPLEEVPTGQIQTNLNAEIK